MIDAFAAAAVAVCHSCSSAAYARNDNHATDLMTTKLVHLSPLLENQFSVNFAENGRDTRNEKGGGDFHSHFR